MSSIYLLASSGEPGLEASASSEASVLGVRQESDTCGMGSAQSSESSGRALGAQRGHSSCREEGSSMAKGLAAGIEAARGFETLKHLAFLGFSAVFW